jgi:hypothetical protein
MKPERRAHNGKWKTFGDFPLWRLAKVCETARSFAGGCGLAEGSVGCAVTEFVSMDEFWSFILVLSILFFQEG